MRLNYRIKAAREAKEWTQEELAKASGVSLQSIKRYESAKDNNITLDSLNKIAEALDVDVELFVMKNMSPSHDSKMSPSVSYSKTLSPSVHKSQKNVPQSESMSPNMSISDSPIGFVNDSLVSSNQKSSDFIKIPVYDDVYASAGAGLINDEHISSHIELDKGFLRSYFRLTSFANLSIIMSSGDSMLPTIPENCYLLIQQGDVKEGKICVTR
ncbi:XRE family transcriptional regulator, partial [Helicobacter muridarum]